MKERRRVPVYQRYRDSGTQSHNLAGVVLAVKAGDPAGEAVTFDAPADVLGGLAPLAGDYYHDDAGRWWEVAAVGEPVDGVYPLDCRRWKGGGA